MNSFLPIETFLIQSLFAPSSALSEIYLKHLNLNAQNIHKVYVNELDQLNLIMNTNLLISHGFN